LVLIAGCGGSGDGAAEVPADGGPAASQPAVADPAADDPAAPAGAPDPCSLLTEDEVAAVVGQVVTRVDGPTDLAGTRTCEWYYPSVRFDDDDWVVVNAWVGLEYYRPDAENSFVDVDAEPVPGIGEEAHRMRIFDDTTNTNQCTILFRDGEVVVQVITHWVAEDACVDLARDAATRI
jgi:hypothetical protein